MRPAPPEGQPTRAELGILQVLWARGPSTVREVFDAIGSQRDIGYTGVLKLLQIMTEKGLVVRDDSNRSHVYDAAVPRARVQRQIVGDVVDTAFEGSTKELVLGALSLQRASREELREIRALILEAERRKAAEQ